jgi:hypothetical protein
MFGFFTKKEPKVITQDAGSFQPIVDVGTVFSYVKVSFDGVELSLGLKTDTVQESKFALEEVKLLRKTIQTAKKEVKAQMSEIRQSQANRVANRGAMIPGGGKVGTVLRFAVRSSRASQRGDVSSQIKAIQDSVISPLDQLLLGCDKFEIVLKKEILAG